MDTPSDKDTLGPWLDDDLTPTRDAVSEEAAAPTETLGPAADNDGDNNEDRPVRVLVQTGTHLISDDRDQWREGKMQDLICQHVWGRDFHKFRERGWNYHCHWTINSSECWFLVDHHGPGPTPPPDPPLIWYQWTRAEL